MNSFYTAEELKALGLRQYGKEVYISRKASLYSPQEISLGDYVRIDDFCILSGKIELGSYVHIAAYSALYGAKEGIFIRDFVNVSSRVAIYAVSDDFSGETLTSPLVPDRYKRLTQGRVCIERQCIIGTGCTILPGVTLREGSACGAMSLFNRDTAPFSINAGIPARKIKERKKDLLGLEQKLRDEER